MAAMVTHTLEIARPPTDVFAYATDPTRFPEWQDDVAEAHLEGGHPPAVGTRFTTTRRIGRVQHRATQEITEYDPPTNFTVRGIDGPLRATATVTIQPLDRGARSRVTFTLEFQGTGVGRLVPETVRQLAAKGAPTSYQHLKDLLEATTSDPTPGGGHR